MATFVEGREVTSKAEPVGLLTEGAAGIAAIVLAILGLAGVSTGVLASIAVIVIGVGLLVQGFNTGAEQARATPIANQGVPEFGGEVMVSFVAGVAGIVLGILALIGIHAPDLVPAALIVFGGALLLAGATSGPMVSNSLMASATQSAGEVVSVSYNAPAASRGLQILIGVSAIVLGILSLILMTTWVLVLVGMLAVGAALLMISATFSGAVMRLFTV
jgi:hypothetical protein